MRSIRGLQHNGRMLASLCLALPAFAVSEGLILRKKSSTYWSTAKMLAVKRSRRSLCNTSILFCENRSTLDFLCCLDSLELWLGLSID